MDSPRKRETADRLINYLLAHVTLALLGNFPFSVIALVRMGTITHMMAKEVVFALICLRQIIIIVLNSVVSSWTASIWPNAFLGDSRRKSACPIYNTNEIHMQKRR